MSSLAFAHPFQQYDQLWLFDTLLEGQWNYRNKTKRVEMRNSDYVLN